MKLFFWFTKLSGTRISGMEKGNGSIFCKEMEPNMIKKGLSGFLIYRILHE